MRVLEVTAVKFSAEGCVGPVLAYCDVEVEGTMVLKRCRVVSGRGGQPFFSFATEPIRVRCEGCGNREAAWHHKFCPNCGERLPPPGEARRDANGYPIRRFDIVAPKSYEQRMAVAEAVMAAWLSWRDARPAPAPEGVVA